MPPVLTKDDFVHRYGANEFGNHSPTWSGYFDWFNARGSEMGCVLEKGDKSNSLIKYHIRNRVAGAMTWYDVHGYEMFEKWQAAIQQFDPGQLYISEMCPTELTTLQGEVLVNSIGRFDLYYSHVPKPMRESLREGGQHTTGFHAELLLRKHMNPRSYGWLRWLLTAYRNHVVEFTCLSRCWGTEPGLNTLFWECRLYTLLFIVVSIGAM